ncbi:MAG: hypothetical protein GY898_27515 [Proteobacteria bacterium]|nr:hypothetical protein [Pseudomonadota bacterium]
MGCRTEAGSLQAREDDFAADHPDIPFSYVISLYADATGAPPHESLGEEYWEDVGEPEFPVGADTDREVLDATPFNGEVAAGKCVLADDLEILDCRTGHGSEQWAWDAILEHAGD